MGVWLKSSASLSLLYFCLLLLFLLFLWYPCLEAFFFLFLFFFFIFFSVLWVQRSWYPPLLFSSASAHTLYTLDLFMSLDVCPFCVRLFMSSSNSFTIHFPWCLLGKAELSLACAWAIFGWFIVYFSYSFCLWSCLFIYLSICLFLYFDCTISIQ